MNRHEVSAIHHPLAYVTKPRRHTLVINFLSSVEVPNGRGPALESADLAADCDEFVTERRAPVEHLTSCSAPQDGPGPQQNTEVIADGP